MDATRGVSDAVSGLPLAALLGSADRSMVGVDAMLDVVAARARLLWQVQGELLHDLSRAVAAALAADPGEDAERVVGAVGELVGWTVHWTAGYARGQVELAVTLGPEAADGAGGVA